MRKVGTYGKVGRRDTRPDCDARTDNPPTSPTPNHPPHQPTGVYSPR